MFESHLERKNLKITNDFLLLFKGLKFIKTSLFCCNCYSNCNFYESQVKLLRKSITKEK